MASVPFTKINFLMKVKVFTGEDVLEDRFSTNQWFVQGLHSLTCILELLTKVAL